MVRFDLTTTDFLAHVLEGRMATGIFPTSCELDGRAPFLDLTDQANDAAR